MARSRKRVNLAIQGGGSHGAYAWGILDRFLEDGRTEIEGSAGTRAGQGGLRTAVKTARAAVDGKAANAAELVKKATSVINGAVTKGIVKRQTASRYVSRLARRTAP